MSSRTSLTWCSVVLLCILLAGARVQAGYADDLAPPRCSPEVLQLLLKTGNAFRNAGELLLEKIQSKHKQAGQPPVPAQSYVQPLPQMGPNPVPYMYPAGTPMMYYPTPYPVQHGAAASSSSADYSSVRALGHKLVSLASEFEEAAAKRIHCGKCGTVAVNMREGPSPLASDKTSDIVVEVTLGDLSPPASCTCGSQGKEKSARDHNKGPNALDVSEVSTKEEEVGVDNGAKCSASASLEERTAEESGEKRTVQIVEGIKLSPETNPYQIETFDNTVAAVEKTVEETVEIKKKTSETKTIEEKGKETVLTVKTYEEKEKEYKTDSNDEMEKVASKDSSSNSQEHRKKVEVIEVIPDSLKQLQKEAGADSEVYETEDVRKQAEETYEQSKDTGHSHKQQSEQQSETKDENIQVVEVAERDDGCNGHQKQGEVDEKTYQPMNSQHIDYNNYERENNHHYDSMERELSELTQYFHGDQVPQQNSYESSHHPMAAAKECEVLAPQEYVLEEELLLPETPQPVDRVEFVVQQPSRSSYGENIPETRNLEVPLASPQLGEENLNHHHQAPYFQYIEYQEPVEAQYVPSDQRQNGMSHVPQPSHATDKHQEYHHPHHHHHEEYALPVPVLHHRNAPVVGAQSGENSPQGRLSNGAPNLHGHTKQQQPLQRLINAPAANYQVDMGIPEYPQMDETRILNDANPIAEENEKSQYQNEAMQTDQEDYEKTGTIYDGLEAVRQYPVPKPLKTNDHNQPSDFTQLYGGQAVIDMDNDKDDAVMYENSYIPKNAHRINDILSYQPHREQNPRLVQYSMQPETHHQFMGSEPSYNEEEKTQSGNSNANNLIRKPFNPEENYGINHLYRANHENGRKVESFVPNPRVITPSHPPRAISPQLRVPPLPRRDYQQILLNRPRLGDLMETRTTGSPRILPLYERTLQEGYGSASNENEKSSDLYQRGGDILRAPIQHMFINRKPLISTTNQYAASNEDIATSDQGIGLQNFGEVYQRPHQSSPADQEPQTYNAGLFGTIKPQRLPSRQHHTPYVPVEYSDKNIYLPESGEGHGNLVRYGGLYQAPRINEEMSTELHPPPHHEPEVFSSMVIPNRLVKPKIGHHTHHYYPSWSQTILKASPPSLTQYQASEERPSKSNQGIYTEDTRDIIPQRYALSVSLEGKDLPNDYAVNTENERKDWVPAHGGSNDQGINVAEADRNVGFPEGVEEEEEGGYRQEKPSQKSVMSFSSQNLGNGLERSAVVLPSVSTFKPASRFPDLSASTLSSRGMKSKEIRRTETHQSSYKAGHIVPEE